MMEAIGQNSAIESKLDAAQNLNNDETNFKLNVGENSPHDDDNDDDDEVVVVNEEVYKNAATNSQCVEVEDDDKMSQTSSNGSNKSITDCDENKAVIDVDNDNQRSLEDRHSTLKIQDENSNQKQLNNEYKEITTKSINDNKDKEKKVEEKEQNENETYVEADTVVDLKAAYEPHSIEKVDKEEEEEIENSQQNKLTPPQVIDVSQASEDEENSLQNKITPPQIIDVSQASEDEENSQQNKITPPQIIDVSQASEDELLKSDDDEDIKEQSSKYLDDKENSDHAVRIEIEDSMDSCNNDSIEGAGMVVNDAAAEAASTQALQQTFPIKEDNPSNNESIDMDHPNRADDSKEVVSISDEESECSIQEEGEDQKQQGSAMDVDVDVVETIKENQVEEVINLDDDTQDGIKSASNIVQLEERKITTECITINEESQDLVVEQKEQEKLQNDGSIDAIDINENSLHSDVEMQQMQSDDEEKFNGIDENSNEGLKIDIADEDDEVDATPAVASTNEEEQNHPTTDDINYFAAENLTDDGENLITSIKRQFLKNEHSSSVPKLNGEHKNSETDATQTVIDIQADAQAVDPAHLDDDDDNNDYSSNLKIVDEHSKDSYSKENSQHSDEASKSPHSQPMLLNDSDDDASRFSMASAHSTSTATSSSHQLVIDHQSEDIEPTPPPPPPPPAIQTYNLSNTLPLLPLKINLKRKLSQTSDTSAASPPKHKMPHLDLQPEHNDDANEMQLTDPAYPIVNGENMDLDVKPTELDLLARSPSPVLKIAETTIEPERPESEVFAQVSQATENPETIETPLAADFSYQTSTARSSPLLNSLLLKNLPPQSDRFEHFPPPQKSHKTKYLCFNCKSGSYNTLIALNEHQNICLANKALLPEVTTSTSPTTLMMRTKTPPVSPQQSLERTVSPANNQQQVPEISLEKRRYYQCSSCRTYHENWNLFLHIREIHKRHTCLYCIRMFPTAEKLSLHLEIKHDLEQNHFNSEEALRKSIEVVEGSVNEARFLMCCTCQHVFLEHEHFSDHVCTEFMQACTLCGQKGRHTNQCKAQNEAKRSKVKKKPKVRDSTTAASLPHESSTLQSNPPSVMPQPEYASNIPHMLATNCDNVEPSPLHATFQPSTIALPTLSLPQPQQQQLHNEDSNSSCNMVIDETCNSTNYSRSTPYNPFKALDERERLEQRTDVAQLVLPPDRNQPSEQAAEVPEPVQPLIVPKFKLRVPKEFQKSVDAAISSTESEDDEELVIHEDDADKHTTSNINSTPSTTPHLDVDNESLTESVTELPTSQEAAEDDNKQPGVAVEDDESLDEPNSNLVRILQEIERTKLDIMRTKETLHTSSKTLAATPRLATISQSSSRAGEHNWSPTPPASPNSQWYTPRRAISHGEGGGGGSSEKEAKKVSTLETAEPQHLPIQLERRRNTTGSDVDMDIDETISRQPVQFIEKPVHREEDPNERNEAADISTETPVDKFSTSTDGSFADIDVENVGNANNGNNANMEETNNPVPVEQENVQQMDTVMAAQKQIVVDQTMPMEEMQDEQPPPTPEKETPTKQEDVDIDICSDKEAEEVEKTQKLAQTPPPPSDGIAVADEETIAVDLQLDRPLEKFQTIEFVRICLKAVYPLCLYCNHARRIAVNGKSLVLHLIAQHRFAATVDSITAEELKPNTIVAKLKSYLPELEEHYFNSNSYCTFGEGAFTHHFNERIFECFQCRFVTSTHKELYLHNRKMHLKTAILCFMCRANFFSFSEILCHVCPGESHKISVFDVKFRCCLCDVDNIPSPFRLMVHLRKKHFACDVCLEDCRDQGRLSSHVWKHKLHHLCYRCGIAYRNKMDITKHLFWKHGTESIICKRCLQKRWRHVYHFCVPPVNFICDICNLCFSKATYLKVHKRIHTGDLRYPCTDDNCEQKFISRRLLLKHTAEHHQAEISTPHATLVEENSKEQEQPDAHVKEELSIKIKEEVLDDVKQLPLKNESNDVPQKGETKSESSGDKTNASIETVKLTASTVTDNGTDCKQRKKKKKSKRSKESLEDLNLIAPNLSESDSSDDSDVETKSKSGDDPLVPNVMLSPNSDAENVKEEDESAVKKESSSDASGKVMDIWKNFLQAQGTDAISDPTEPNRDPTDYTEDYYPTPHKLHVAQSDHDYCVMFKPEPPKTLIQQVAPTQTSPHKRKTAKSPRHTSARRSDGSSGSSSGGSSGSSSDSSCSCGSNCSCSSSNSGSSSSSSSSNDSGESSAVSHSSRKRHRKKSDRDRMRKKSESVSPMKKHNMSVNGGKSMLTADVDVGTEASTLAEPSEPIPPKEPLFYESDLETAESETDEEFYDEHPQKLATELLAQKRAQLMAQTRLSPSHNFDIVENSRPSTPSLPDEVARERKVKLKKKKRERKSTSRSMIAGAGVPPLKLNLGIAASPSVIKGSVPNQLLPDHLPASAQQSVPLNTATNMGPSYELMRRSSFGIAEMSSGTHQQFNATTHTAGGPQLTPRPIGPQHHMGRMSEGSSCSDADASLKRSKRARRPNKFYGYTSDEEHNMTGLGQPLMIGMRAIKPQPPPQLTWRKEDLPTPSKSIINNNKIKTPRTPKTPNTPHNAQTLDGSLFNTNLSGPVPPSLKKNRAMRGSDNAKIRKRISKKSTMGSKLPPIPTFKIRSSQIGLAPTHPHMQVPTVGGGTNHIPASQIYSSSKESDDDDDDEEVDSTDSSSDDDGSQQMAPSTSAVKAVWNSTFLQAPGATSTAPVTALILPQVAPAPPPQAVAFNQKIPPALLPNPDFATLQYFKANNIRYPIRPPAGARQAREGESVYCYCRCPYDEVSEMIACDGENCLIEWFHFECVGIMVAPQGKWFCAECRPKYSEELYPTAGTA